MLLAGCYIVQFLLASTVIIKQGRKKPIIFNLFRILKAAALR